jgi:hypothetical protein
LLETLKPRIAESEISPAATGRVRGSLRTVLIEREQLFCRRHGQWLEYNRVEQREDGCVRADPEGKRHNDDNREGSIRGEKSAGMTQILPQVVQPHE